MNTRKILASVAAGAVLTVAATGLAKADPVGDYINIGNGAIVCNKLDANPTVAGVEDVLLQLREQGNLTPEGAAEVLGRSVYALCPEHVPEIDGFIAKWSTDARKIQA